MTKSFNSASSNPFPSRSARLWLSNKMRLGSPKHPPANLQAQQTHKLRPRGSPVDHQNWPAQRRQVKPPPKQAHRQNPRRNLNLKVKQAQPPNQIQIQRLKRRPNPHRCDKWIHHFQMLERPVKRRHKHPTQLHLKAERLQRESLI